MTVHPGRPAPALQEAPANAFSSGTTGRRLDPLPAPPEENRQKAVIFMLLAVSLFAFLDSAAKLSGREVPTIEVVWFRFAVHFVLVAIVFNPWRAPQAWRTRAPKLQLARACVQIFCTGLNFLALGYLQIAQTLSIQFTTPIFVTILSVFFLAEQVGRYRWFAILMGFAGVLVVTRPGMDGFHWAFGISLASVMVGASYNIMTRRLAATESPGSMLLIMAAFPALVLLPVVPFIWVWPTSTYAWCILIATGFFGAVSHFFMIQAHRYAPASFLAPLQYAQFLAVILLGFLIFGDVPTVYTFVGASIVIASGLFIWYRERKLSKRVVR
jgi:drug/metabolite transporter (DMT)-like permease